MKKIFFLLIIIALIVPVSAFAAAPSELDVEQAASAVLAGFGAVFLASMFGQTPEGVKADVDMTTGNSKIIFNNFDTAAFFDAFTSMQGVSDDNDLPEIFFKTMSGTIAVDENGDMICDMKLDGGPVKTLQIKTSGEDLEYLKADGKDFTYLENFMKTE